MKLFEVASDGTGRMGQFLHDSRGKSERSDGEGEEGGVIERSGQREDGNVKGAGWAFANEGEGVGTTSGCMTSGELC